MRIANTDEHYGLVTKLLHWSQAVLITGLVALGWYMVDLTYFDRWYNDSLAIHKVLGLVALACAALMLTWQQISPPPDTKSTLKAWERVTARVMHATLYAMMVLIPVTGYLVSTSAGKPVDVFGWLEIPALIDVDDELRDLAIESHYYLSYATAVLVCLHAGAALKHQFVDRVGTLARMLWR